MGHVCICWEVTGLAHSAELLLEISYEYTDLPKAYGKHRIGQAQDQLSNTPILAPPESWIFNGKAEG